MISIRQLIQDGGSLERTRNIANALKRPMAESMIVVAEGSFIKGSGSGEPRSSLPNYDEPKRHN